MRNKFSTVAILLTALMLSPSCSSYATDEEGFPDSPAEGQSYQRDDGSTGVWNAMLGYWMISSIINGQRVQNRYYPATNSFTNTSGTKITRPSYYDAPKSTRRSTSRSSGFGSSSRGSSGS